MNKVIYGVDNRMDVYESYNQDWVELARSTAAMVPNHKIAPGAYVRKTNNPVYFMASTDSFGGNSGSAVFNSETGEVEGILTRGEVDYTYDKAHKCYRVNKCEDDGCQGELVNRITNIRPLMELLKDRQ